MSFPFQRSGRFALLVILLLSNACQAAPVQPTAPPAPSATPQPVGPGGLPFPLKTAALQFGVASHLFYTSRALPLKRATEAGFGWVRQQIHWSDQEGPPGRYLWGELDDIVASVNAHGLKLLISIVSAPT